MKLPKLTLLYISLLTFSFLLAPLSVHAQTAIPSQDKISIIVSPPRYDATVNPGETIQKTIKVTNPSETDPLTLTASITDFIVQDDAGTPVKVTEASSGRYLASPWFTLDTPTLTLGPRESGQVTAVITIPADALPGGHYAGVFFEPVNLASNIGSASYLSAQVGSLFGLTVAGDISYDALIKDFKVGSRLYEYGPVDFSATVENQSDTHIRPKSKIVIKNMLGQQLDELILEELNIFPFTARSLSGQWETTWGFGRYTATLEVSYGPGLQTARTLYFWLIPYRILAAIFILLLVLLVAYISIRRHLVHRADSRDREIDELKRKIIELENRQ